MAQEVLSDIDLIGRLKKMQSDVNPNKAGIIVGYRIIL